MKLGESSVRKTLKHTGFPAFFHTCSSISSFFMSKDEILITCHSRQPIAKRHTSALAYHLVAVCLNMPLSLLQSCHTDVGAPHHLPISTILYRICSLFPICQILSRLISNHHHQCPDFMEDLYICIYICSRYRTIPHGVQAPKTL